MHAVPHHAQRRNLRIDVKPLRLPGDGPCHIYGERDVLRVSGFTMI
jgi:hypothetical protein